jgi:hypothetical protein
LHLCSFNSRAEEELVFLCLHSLLRIMKVLKDSFVVEHLPNKLEALSSNSSTVGWGGGEKRIPFKWGNFIIF